MIPEAIALSVISQQPRTRLPKTLGWDGDNDSDCCVNQIASVVLRALWIYEFIKDA